MLYNENLHEEERHLIQQIAEQTERGKIGWELTEYNPLSFLNEDKIDKNPAVICQSFSFGAIIGGSRYELDVMENIDVPSGMGDYTITLTRDETENYLKIEDAVHCARRTVPGGVPVSSDLFFSRQGTVHKVTLSVLRSRENSMCSVEMFTGHTPYTFPIITE